MRRSRRKALAAVAEEKESSRDKRTSVKTAGIAQVGDPRPWRGRGADSGRGELDSERWPKRTSPWSSATPLPLGEGLRGKFPAPGYPMWPTRESQRTRTAHAHRVVGNQAIFKGAPPHALYSCSIHGRKMARHRATRLVGKSHSSGLVGPKRGSGGGGACWKSIVGASNPSSCWLVSGVEAVGIGGCVGGCVGGFGCSGRGWVGPG